MQWHNNRHESGGAQRASQVAPPLTVSPTSVRVGAQPTYVVVAEPGVLRLSAHTALSVERGVLCSSWGSPNGERRPHLRRTERSTFISRRRERRTVRSAFSLGDHERRTGRSTFIYPHHELRPGRSPFILASHERRTGRSTFTLSWGATNVERCVLRSSCART